MLFFVQSIFTMTEIQYLYSCTFNENLAYVTAMGTDHFEIFVFSVHFQFLLQYKPNQYQT